MLRIINTLIQKEETVEVCCEETLNEILDRYLDQNDHASSQTWKRLGRPLDMNKTLEQNGIIDERDEFRKLGISDNEYIPALHI